MDTFEGNLIPTDWAALTPVALALSREVAVLATCLLFKILVVETPGDSLSMSEAIAIHNLFPLFGLFPLFAPPKSAAKLDARRIAPAISEQTALGSHTGVAK